jgi:hypothetical protein
MTTQKFKEQKMTEQKLFDLQCQVVSDDTLRPDVRIASVLKIQKALEALHRAELTAMRILHNMTSED